MAEFVTGRTYMSGDFHFVTEVDEAFFAGVEQMVSVQSRGQDGCPAAAIRSTPTF